MTYYLGHMDITIIQRRETLDSPLLSPIYLGFIFHMSGRGDHIVACLEAEHNFIIV